MLELDPQRAPPRIIWHVLSPYQDSFQRDVLRQPSGTLSGRLFWPLIVHLASKSLPSVTQCGDTSSADQRETQVCTYPSFLTVVLNVYSAYHVDRTFSCRGCSADDCAGLLFIPWPLSLCRICLPDPAAASEGTQSQRRWRCQFKHALVIVGPCN
jgi:hypothetical protein